MGDIEPNDKQSPGDAVALEEPSRRRSVRIRERTIGKISRGFAHILDQPEWVSWDRAVAIIRNAVCRGGFALVKQTVFARQPKETRRGS